MHFNALLILPSRSTNTLTSVYFKHRNGTFIIYFRLSTHRFVLQFISVLLLIIIIALSLPLLLYFFVIREMFYFYFEYLSYGLCLTRREEKNRKELKEITMTNLGGKKRSEMLENAQ